MRAHLAPLFSRMLAAQRGRIYLANHSLGRPLDATADDVREGLELWTARLGDAWDAWNCEIAEWRARLATLMGAPRPDCVVPKTSAGQGLRAVLNAHDGILRVVATRGEFDSLDVILREYAHRGRIALELVEPRDGSVFAADDLGAAMAKGADLVVVSQVMFRTGQVLPELPAIVGAAHSAGARVLVDLYHSLGVFPVDVAALDVGLRRRGQLQIPSRRAGRVLSVRASAPSRWPPAHARHRLVRESGAVSLRASRPAALRAGRRCVARIDARGAAALPVAGGAAASSSRSASRGCGTIRSRCSGGSSRCSRSAGSRRRAAAKTAALSSPCAVRTPAGFADALAARVSSPTRATNGCASVPTC